MEFAPRSPGEAPVSEETVLSILRQATRSDKDVSTIADWLMKMSGKLFADLHPDVFKSVCAAVELRTYEPNQIVVMQGDVGLHFFVIASGSVSVLIADDEGRLREARAQVAEDIEAITASAEVNGMTSPLGSFRGSPGRRKRRDPVETEPNVSNTAIPFFLDPRGPEEYAQGRRLSQSRRASLTRPRPVIGGPAASPLLSTPVPPTQEGEDGLNGTPKLTSEQLAGMLPPRRYTNAVGTAPSDAPESSGRKLEASPGPTPSKAVSFPPDSDPTDPLVPIPLFSIDGVPVDHAASVDTGSPSKVRQPFEGSGRSPNRTRSRKLLKSQIGREIGTLAAGSSFGELALATDDCYRTATVVAITETSLIVISRAVYMESMQRKVREDMDDRLAFLRALPCFRLWSKRKVMTLAYACQPVTVPVRSHLYRARDQTNGIFFVKSGYCKVLESVKEAPPPRPPNAKVGLVTEFVHRPKETSQSRVKQLELAVFGPGSVLGETETLCGEPYRLTSALATERMEVLHMPAGDFASFLAKESKVIHWLQGENARKEEIFAARRAGTSELAAVTRLPQPSPITEDPPYPTDDALNPREQRLPSPSSLSRSTAISSRVPPLPAAPRRLSSAPKLGPRAILPDPNGPPSPYLPGPEEPNAKSAVGTQLPLLGRTSSVSGLSPYLPPPVAIEVPAVDDEAVKEVDNMMHALDVQHSDRDVAKKIPRFHRFSLGGQSPRLFSPGSLSPRLGSPPAPSSSLPPHSQDVWRPHSPISPIMLGSPPAGYTRNQSGGLSSPLRASQPNQTQSRQTSPEPSSAVLSPSGAGQYFTEFSRAAPAPSVVPWFSPTIQPRKAIQAKATGRVRYGRTLKAGKQPVNAQSRERTSFVVGQGHHPSPPTTNLKPHTART